ncbi:MAG: histidinol-phosphatase [Clostridia bacterium]|nr:histidinol-phosphatase [Clostridia bacterium]
MSYLYETHLHTCQASACGVSTGREHARFYKEIGFKGIFVTDHFFGGNTAVPRNRPWRERIDMFCAGYEDALAEGQRIGLDVFFGWEQGYGDDEYLIYGLDKQWLLAHPEVETWSRREQLEGIRRAGGCIVQAHPFRTRDYIRHVRIGLGYCDAIEAANAGNHPHNDAYALRYAQMYGLPMIAGSDNHRSSMENLHRIYGVRLESPLLSAADFAHRIRSGAPITLNVPQDRFSPAECPPIDSYFIDEHEGLRPTNRPSLCDWA